MLKPLKTLNELGDTIVEVMIVLAVLGLALSISYATANRSLLNTRQAQENSTATELAQAQIESLLPLAGVPSTDTTSHYIYLGLGQPFCISGGQVKKFPTPATPAPECQNIDSFYIIAVTQTDVLNNKTFTVVVTWDDVSGQGPDSVTLEYRLYPPS